MDGDTVKIILAILGSNAFFSFLQFLISRRDNKRGIQQELGRISKKIDENAAILARTHILRFSDEIKNGIIHSREYWRQQLDDCDTYDRFCHEHPDFKNSYTETASEHVRETFKELVRDGKL